MLHESRNGFGALTVVLHVIGPKEWFRCYTLQDLRNGFDVTRYRTPGTSLVLHVTGPRNGFGVTRYRTIGTGLVLHVTGP